VRPRIRLFFDFVTVFPAPSMQIRSTFLLLFVLTATLLAQVATSVSPLPPDDRFKTDVLLIVGHPDDETAVSAYLAELLDQHKRVAIVYLTHGEAGHNNEGSERAATLGAAREMEVRHAMSTLGIENVWFLDGKDTPSQNVLQSLARWRHGLALEEVVRMVRFTRPEVIITWLPGFFIGENHGDHQASGVLATEAFDLAGDPGIFPSQLAAPVKVNETLLEGLRPWQAKKIYYFSDANDQAQFKGTGPVYTTTEISPTRHLPYWQLAMNAFSFHLTQYRSYIERLKQKSLTEQQNDWGDPVQLTFGKSNVGGDSKGDVFAGITPAPIALVHPAFADLPSPQAFELAGPWGFYEVFRREHGLTQLPRAAVPEIAISRGADLQIPLTVRNLTDAAQSFTLSVTAPANWTNKDKDLKLSLQPHEVVPTLIVLGSPVSEEKAIQEIVCRAEAEGKTLGTITLHVRLRSGGLPQ